MNTKIQNVQETMKSNPLFKILLIGFLILLLLIPIVMIENVIRERAMTKSQAVSEVTSKWGSRQNIIGPMITVPYTRRHLIQLKDQEPKYREVTRLAVFFPETLDMTSDITTQVLHRGIYEVPVYSTRVILKGTFRTPDFAGLNLAPCEIAWDKAQLVLSLSDVRAVQDRTNLSWNEQDLAFLPGTGELVNHVKPHEMGGGIHVPLKNHLDGGLHDFSITLNVKGNGFLGFTPLGRNTKVSLRSGWPHPSFQGNWLPSKREVNKDGFTAQWNVSYLGRNFAQVLPHISDYTSSIRSSVFGVSLIKPVDPYRMSLRSVKYAVLFLALTFVSFWLFELMAGLRVHTVQYLFIGSAISIFYLLNLSLAEHAGFLLSYILATAAVAAMISLYSLVVLKTGKRAAVIAGIIGSLYGCLYILLKEQDYALLIGSFALFLILGVIMYVTRKIDWYNFGSKTNKDKDLVFEPEE